MDDDIVLNIDTSSGVPSRKTGQKGGRWVDRLKVKRAVKRKAQAPSKLTKSTEPTTYITDVDDRPTKRPHRDRTTPHQPSESTKPTSTPAPPRQTQFISSLFTSNPKIVTLQPETPAMRLPTKPSNAPLDTSSFEGLGLHPLLVSHLTSRMNISKPTAIQRSSLPSLLASPEDGTERDAFIQSQTGSGKTLSYLLPIVHDLLPLSSLSYIDRSIGTLAIIIAPTRELAKQISDVLEALLKLRLRAENESADDPNPASRLTRWLVSGLLIGGENRTHEKARLRKGVPILVTTPGRLLDHLQNTSSFNIGKCRWLVLDEADHLMELGFEETITGILKGLEGRHRLAKQAVEEGKSMEVGGWDWKRRRRTILCSATIREDVQKLAGTALVNPLIIKAVEIDKGPEPATGRLDPQSSEKFTPPSQLTQKYVVAPLKLRLVTLVALLRSLVAQAQGRRSTKIIVFFSCTDSVDFHWNLLAEASMGEGEGPVSNVNSDEDSSEETEKKSATDTNKHDAHERKCPLLPDTSIYRLHGSLPTQTRLSVVKSFSGTQTLNASPTSSSILLCTSVASRGLDLPLVRAVVQYDLPTEGGATEYVHRVGRTARAGKGGEAWSIVAPSEIDWVQWVQEKMDGGGKESESEVNQGNVSLTPIAIEEILGSGFGGRGQEYEERATEVQLAFERWVLREKQNSELARTAFLSHMRAYATHPSGEKHIFHIRHLHLGHLAKAFALREAPKSITWTTAGAQKSRKKNEGHPSAAIAKNKAVKSHQQQRREWEINHSGEAEKRMQNVVRAQGRLTKKGGVMMSSGVSEFQIAGGDALEKLVHGS
ncbi:DEAD-domain-containing protein [Macrolepiota fuliginosa MF-IS2]|uniref:ATP-dependent RNA helicase n=1 Tax=Macrolepiota fuliginosa MF-IS2 TaxID=1400762 RepID=A0A9P6C8Z5_9AGAR|nr:DEAD-domain-containing protein [Macrolepiota fuliginosa MF-IS2]